MSLITLLVLFCLFLIEASIHSREEKQISSKLRQNLSGGYRSLCEYEYFVLNRIKLTMRLR